MTDMPIMGTERPFRRVYWLVEGSIMTCCGEPDKANRVVLEMRHGPYTTDQIFNWPEDRYHVEKLERMLMLAAEWGERKRAGEIRDSLRSLIGL